MLFIETSTFTKQLSRHFDDDSYAALQAFLSVHPEAGDVIRGSRVIYYWLAEQDHIYLLTVYAKGVKDDLTATGRDAWRKAVEAIDHD